MPCWYFRSLVQHHHVCDPADPGIRSSCYLVQHHLGRTGYPVLRNLRSQETDPQEAVDVEVLALATAEPTAEEKAKLDKQYKAWRIGAYCAAIAGILLFVIAWIV